VLSESSLSDELDRALEGESEPGGEAVGGQAPAESEPGDLSDEPDSGAYENGEPDSNEPETAEADSSEMLYEDAATEAEPDAESGTETGGESSDPDFFDQDDPLEATPDFLEETPEHDRLWFEQKEPKDFDFGD